MSKRRSKTTDIRVGRSYSLHILGAYADFKKYIPIALFGEESKILLIKGARHTLVYYQNDFFDDNLVLTIDPKSEEDIDWKVLEEALRREQEESKNRTEKFQNGPNLGLKLGKRSHN